MKRLIYTLAILLSSLGAMAQTAQPLPSGAYPFSNQLYLSPSDSTVWTGDAFSDLFIKVGSWHKVDSLFKLGYTKTQVDSAIAAQPVPNITLTGNVTGTGSGTIATTIANAAVTYARMQNFSALSVLGRSANSVGVSAGIVAGTDGHVLRRSGTALGFGTIGDASISDLAYSKLTGAPNLSVYELLANKATTFGTLNNTLYPTTQAVAGNFVDKTTNQSNILGTKYWGNSHTWELSGTSATPDGTVVQIGHQAGSTPGPYIRGFNAGALSFILRGYASSGVQLTLSEGGISIPQTSMVGGGLSSGGEAILRRSESSNVLLSSHSGGIIYLRPNGTGSATGQTIFNANGTIANSALATSGNNLLNRDAGDARYLQLSGGTLTGPLTGTTATFSGNVTAATAPTLGGHLANKDYVDAQSVIEALDEGNGIGYRIRGRNPANYGNIGFNAVDFSLTGGASSTLGATGTASVAYGSETTASGGGSFASGNVTVASGDFSASFGHQSMASGLATLSGGSDSFASGDYSTAFGSFSVANEFSSLAIGRYSTEGAIQTGWVVGSPIFKVGNGTGGGSSRSNAYVLYNDGRSEQVKDVEVTEIGQGVVIKSPDGTRWRITVDNSGTLTTTAL